MSPGSTDEANCQPPSCRGRCAQVRRFRPATRCRSPAARGRNLPPAEMPCPPTRRPVHEAVSSGTDAHRRQKIRKRIKPPHKHRQRKGCVRRARIRSDEDAGVSNPPFLRTPLHLSGDTPPRVPREGPPGQRAPEPDDTGLEPIDERLQPRRAFPKLAGAKLATAGGGALHDVGEADSVTFDKHRDGGGRVLDCGGSNKTGSGNPGRFIRTIGPQPVTDLRPMALHAAYGHICDLHDLVVPPRARTYRTLSLTPPPTR